MKLYLVEKEAIILQLEYATPDNFDWCSDAGNSLQCTQSICRRSATVVSKLKPFTSNNPRQKEYISQLQERIGENADFTLKIKVTRDITLLSQVCDIDRFTVPIREEPVRFLGGVVEDMQHDFRETSTSLSNPRKRSGVEMRVSGELFRQLASYCAYSKEGQVLVKIKVGDIHVEWDRGKDNFCGRSRDEDACSGMNLATDYMPLPQGATGVAGTDPEYRDFSNNAWSIWSSPSKTIHATLRISVSLRGLDYLEERFVPGKGKTFKRMLEEEVATDLVIVAKNGKKRKCHKGVLMVQSPVLNAMFQHDTKEKATSTIKMSEMTEKGVNAMLAFLYCSEIEDAANKVEIAVELLEASHKYGMTELEAIIRNILLTKHFAWFTFTGAVRLLLFARNVEAFADLTLKATEYLKMNFHGFRASKLYKKLYRDSPQILVDIYEVTSHNHEELFL